MSMSDHIKQQVVQEILPNRSSLLENGKSGFFSFIRVEEVANIHNVSLGSMAYYFKLLHTVEYRTTERTTSNR